ncbi:MAG: ubiquinone/menaquinone biosynthesis methyltransferase [Thermoanaerobaculia bacterium]|nr:ubiquinone/menaquinone biosynthesis methyltransferase [Thermoanaerobaculia bacterium]
MFAFLTQEARPGSGAMFDAIARRYDLVNRIMSLGLDRWWRRTAVAALKLPTRARALDVATGTADVALEIASQADDVEVIGVDPSPRMLEIGRTKVTDAELNGRVDLRTGEAENLTFESDTFDGVISAWGIRNAADRAGALREMTRVTNPGGRVAILESLEAPGLLLGPMIRFYTRTVVPFLGGLISRRKQEYQYLQTSIAAFPKPEEFHMMMRSAGLQVEVSKPLTFGACWLFVGRKTAEVPSDAEGSAS